MKLTSFFFCIVVILSSCSDTPDAVRSDISITDDGKFYEKAQLIRSVRFENTSYQLYENLVCVAHDTTNKPNRDVSWSTESLSLYKNDILEAEFFKDVLFIDRDFLIESSNSVYVSEIRSDEKMTLLQFDLDFTSAPGYQTVSFLQLQDHNIMQSDICQIAGSFITKNGDIEGVGWSGYFAYELPFNLTEGNEMLHLDFDFLNVQRENEYYILKIKDGVRFPPNACELDMIIDPFGDTPLATKTVTLVPNTQVTLLRMAVEDPIQSDFYFENWVKINVSGQEGWIENDADLRKIGCLAAG
jgi:hypothetical protein